MLFASVFLASLISGSVLADHGNGNGNRFDITAGRALEEVRRSAQSVEDRARDLSRTIDQRLYDRDLQRSANYSIRSLESEISRLRGALARLGQDNGNGRDRFQWVRVGDYPPAQCAGTPQAGDSSPYIVRSPEDVGARCDRGSVGQTFCDAGAEGGRYLDRHWVCQRQ